MYVTLEPCCHQGRQPPCTDAILEAGIARVVVGSDDPNPLVAGKGIDILRRAGVEVETGVLKAECDALNYVFFHYITTGLPYVVMKYAMTLDGKIATCSGKSKWITGEAAREQVRASTSGGTKMVLGCGCLLAVAGIVGLGAYRVELGLLTFGSLNSPSASSATHTCAPR